VFLDDEDRETDLALLAKNASAAELEILGYCLRTNHVHLIVVPKKRDSMATTFRRVHGSDSPWLNMRLRQTGHAWQSRYCSCPLGPSPVAYAMRYVEFNPVRAERVESVLDYPWCSAQAHAGLIAAHDWLKTRDGEERYPPRKGKEVLGLGFRYSGDLDRLREATRTGRPFGADDFVAEREAKLDRNFLPQKPGPKPKEASPEVRAGARMEIGS
jgi:putative transposase